nr:type II toxin-antitoxin system VapC family toxin [Laspinema sp. D2d]
MVDTNVLLRVADRRNPQHEIARTAVRKLKQDQHQLQVLPQNCVEFWNVMTRPLEKNGLGLTPIEADRLLCLIERLFPVCSDPPTLYSEWRRLVVTFQVSGVQVHDARLVAAMKVIGMTHILTFNTKDFTRYAQEKIVPVHPATV